MTEERKIPGHLHRQQAELEYKQRSCAQKKGGEQVLLPKEAEILLCVQENDGDFPFLPVSCVECSVLYCGIRENCLCACDWLQTGHL